MEKNSNNNTNRLIQRIKQINKQNNCDYKEFIVKYFPKNNEKENSHPIICVEREFNILKKISNEPISEEEKEKLSKNLKEKFEKEMTIIMQFSHPNIIKIMDYFEQDENIFHVITENYQYDLSEFIKIQLNKKKYFSESIILSIFTQICLGIKYIHDLNILHRNINPSNILLISNKVIKISNFDFYRLLFNSNERSITFVNNSWKEYMSPEMNMNIPYSFKNDIWSLGILLFHMMALKVPFNYKQLNEIQNIKKVDANYIISKIPRHFSNDIKYLCVDLLKAYPADRPDINSILSKYRIIKNQIKEIGKIIGGVNIINPNNFNIKNIYKNKGANKNKNEEKNVINNKKKFNFIKEKLVKIGDDKKNKINNKIKEKNGHKISLYENIKEKVKDPNNIMEDNYITGTIINLPDNIEALDLTNLIKNNNSKQEKSSSNNEN